MTTIVYFKPQAQLSAAANLTAFIALVRDKVKVWENLKKFDWDSSRWPTHMGNIRYLKLKERGLHHSIDMERHHIMQPPFLDFAKAYLRYDQQKKQTKTFKRTIAALQLLESSLIELEGQPDVTKVSVRHLDRAAELLQEEGFKGPRSSYGPLCTKND